MRPAVRGRGSPWFWAIALHVVLVALLAAAALRWRSDPPPEQLAIEGNVVRYEDLPPSVKAGKPLREPTVEPPTPPKPEPEPEPEAPPPEPEPEPVRAEPPPPDPAIEAAAKARREQELVAQREAEAQRVAQERKAEQARKAEAAAKAEAEAAKAKADAREKAESARKAEEARKADEQRKAQEAREAKARAEQESDLQRRLASEEEGEAVVRSGVVDEYRAMLVQTIERNWIRPPSAQAGLECTLQVTQAPGGTVLDVRITACNGDAAVRESVANAVYRSSPLPAPRDPRAFQRNLVMVFKPRE